VSSKEFYFALRLPAEPSPAMVRDLVSRVCATSCASDAAELVGQVEAALARAAAGGPCELRFTAHGGALNVAIASRLGPLWQTSRPID
jgi:hypothetical protein